MMIKENFDLKPYNSFGISAQTRYFAEYSSVKELTKLTLTDEYLKNEVLHIGAGSNLLFIGDYNGLVLHSAIRGVTFYRKDDSTVYAIVGAGEILDDVIAEAVEKGYGGLENLSAIPGEVGAAAVQNVGAYGVEAKDVIFAVECYDTVTHGTVRFTPEECRFGYRDSMFKHEGKGRYIVIRVSFKLTDSTEAQNLEYGQLRDLKERLGHHPSISEVRSEVMAIRAAKLPDPKIMGNAGSFFKNPVVSRLYFEHEVLRRHPEVPHYDIGNDLVKVPAGWLIEHAGLKGYTVGGAQVYPNQCLIIVNRGNATAGDIVGLSTHIRNTIRRECALELEPEVNFIDSSIHIRILGSGTSKGVPEIGCRCDTCLSEDAHDKRLRSSILVRTHGMNILIDASPDLRQQALSAGLDRVDAVLLTHIHYDHVGGLDDLRPFCTFRNVPLYASEDVEKYLRVTMAYAFREHPYPGVPTFDMHRIDDAPFSINGLKIIPIRVMHASMPIFGYRIGNFAYITDASHIDEWELDKLEGVDTLIINALRREPHFAHFTLEQALEVIDKVKPRKAWLTHICHDMGLYSEVEPTLPEGVHLAYDGLEITSD